MTADLRAVEIIRRQLRNWMIGDLYLANATQDILDALTAAGWSLLPPGGQTGEVWRCVYLDTGGAFIAHSRDALERHCAVTRCHDPGPLDPPPRPWQHQTAQRTVWPDGREHTTPWQPSDTPGEPA